MTSANASNGQRWPGLLQHDAHSVTVGRAGGGIRVDVQWSNDPEGVVVEVYDWLGRPLRLVVNSTGEGDPRGRHPEAWIETL